jgi:hypothetical protein
MELNLARTIVFGLVLAIALISWQVTSESKIPSKWLAGLTLRYNVSHAMSGDFSGYFFTSDSLQVHSRKLTSTGIAEQKYTKKITKEKLKELLEVVKSNHVDKMKIRKTNITMYDGASFSFHLMENGKPIVMLSNSAYEELSNRDAARLNKVLIFIRLAAQMD